MAGQLDSQAASVSPVNVQEFAKKVKEKYPEYKDVDDLTLAQKIVEKYPEYKDRVSFDQPEESGQPKTYMENYLDERFPSQTKPEQTEISPTASLHSSLPYVNVDKGQIVPSVQEPKKQVSFDANAAPAIGQEKTVQQVIPQQQSKQEEYFEPAAQNVGGAQISSVQPEESLIFSTPEEEKIDLAKNIIDRSKRQANAVTGEGDNTGVGDALRDRNFWTLGSSDLSSMIYLKKIANKLEDGSPLTDGDKALLEAWNQSEQINQQYPASKANIWYKTGKNVTDMIPWLVQFAATRGTSATIRKGVETSLKKNAEKFLGANIAKGLSKGIAEVAGAYAAAAFMPNTYADITRRTLGQTYQDEQGNVKFDVSEADGNVKAIYKGWTNGMLEVLTERLGEGVTEGLKLLPKNKITSLLAGEAKGKAGKIFSDFTKSVGWNGVPLEYLEEWVNVPLNAMLVGDSKYSDMFDGKQQLETFLTVAAMGSAMGTAQMAANKYDAYKINRDYKSAKNLFNTDIDQQTRTTVESLVNSDIDIYDLSDQLDGVLASVDGEKAGIIMNYVIQSMKHSNFKQKPITTATIEGQQYTINNPEDLGQEGKPIFAKDAEGNVIPVQNHKVTNPVTQTVEQIDQANQQEAERVKLYAGISDPSAQITEEVNEDNIRLVSFSNGQSKIITPEGEVIANNEAEKDRILEAVVNGEPLPQPKVTDTGEVISPAPERKVITQKIGNTPIDIIEGEEFDEVVPTEKVPLDKALPVLEKKFKDIKDFKLEVEKVQVEEPGETKYDKPVKKTVIKSIKIVPVAKIGNIENVNQEKVSEIQQQAIEQQQIVNTEQPESSQKNQLQNEESKNVNGEVAGAAPQAEDTPQAEQGQGVNEGLEENVNTNESTVANVMAADYLFNGGVGVLGSSDYLIKSLTGAFAKASGLIEQIRQRYAREINDSNLGYIKDFVNTELYNKVMADIRNAINTSYNNNQEVIDIFDQILQYPTGLPVKLGTQLSIQLESINESAVPPVVGESFTPGDSAGQITEKQITEQEKINAKKARQQAKQVSPEEQKQRSINKAKALSIEPSTIEQLVLQYIVAGNRLNWDEIKREVFPRSDSEMKQRIWMLKKDAKTIDQLLGLLNGTTMEEEGNQPNAFRNAVIDAVLRNGTRTQMVDRILEIGDQNNNQQNIADYEQRMAEAAEAFEQEERNNELLAWEEYLTELENNGQLPTENELIELFLQDNTTTNEQAVNQAGNSEQDRPVNPEKNEGNGQVISGSKPGNDGKNAIKESPKELTPLEKEIQSLQKERAELLSKKVKTVKNVNARNGLFGDIAAQPNDLFAGQGFDATEAQRIIKSIDDRISVIDQTIEDLSAKNEQVKATSEKENAGQQEINIPDRTLEAKQVQDVAGQDSGQRPAVPQSPLSKVLSDGKKEVQEKKQNQKNAKFENQNNDNEIPESVSQRERTAQDQEDKRLEEVATRLADGISQSEGKGASSQRDTEARIVLDYAKENGLWINDIYDLGEHFSSGNESTVVVDVEKGVVYKSNNLMNSITISNLLQQIKIHNQLFPSTRYSLVGFTGIDNGVNRPPYIEVILSQPLINESVPANDIEINQYMKSLGFERTGDGVFSNGDYILRDIHPRNVLKDAAGDIYVIDNIIKPSEQKQQDSASFKEEAPKNDQQKQQDSAYGQNNKIVSKERADELRKRLRDKLNNLNSGFDPEVLAIGTELAAYHIEAGARKFADFSKAMIDDIGDAIKPYLKAIYNGARDLPGMEELEPEMTEYSEVKKANIDELLKQTPENDVELNKNNQPNGKQRILQRNNKRASKPKSPSLFDRVDPEQGTGGNAGLQGDKISGTNEPQQQPAGRKGNLLPGNADLLEPALVEFNAEENDAKAFNPTQKYNDNIKAIETVISLISEKRKATSEEKEILSKYVGFGGLKDILLNPDLEEGWTASSNKYKPQVKRIIELAEQFDKVTGTSGSLNSIKGSILNAHFTSSSVIHSVYEGISKLGFTGGRILEPSSGIGNFITFMPHSIKGNSNITAVELDDLTGHILKYLHDDVNVKVSGIQDANIPNNSQDLVISNVPFGNYKIFDKSFKGEKAQFQNRIHNYFFAKAVDMAREGGLIAFVTSKGVMDAPGNESLRRYLDQNTEFLGAARLPNNAFKNNANTEVVTDIIFLKKNTTGVKNSPDFVSVKEVEAVHRDGEKQNVTVNQYFIDHPENMLGEIVAGGLYSRDDYTVENKTGYDLTKAITQALPAGVYKTVSSDIGSQANDSQETIDAIKEGNIEFTGDRLVRKEEGQLVEIKINEPTPKIQHYIKLRNTLMNLIYSEYLGKGDAELNTIRINLNNEYDSFVKKYGLLEKSATKIAKQDADGYNVLSLEVKGKQDGKADIFRQRTIQPIHNKLTADSIDEAIVISLYEHANINIERVAELMNLSIPETLEKAKGKIFEEPTGGFVTRDEYLSGNVKKKLKEAQQAVADGNTEFQFNVDELQNVIPKDIPAMNIEARLGSRWIPATVFSDFAKFLFNTPNAEITYIKSIDDYSNNGRIATVEATSKYGTSRRNGADILIDALRLSPPKIYDKIEDKQVLNVEETAKANEKYEEIRQVFEDWVYREGERRDLLGRIYNEKYNTSVARQYNGDHLNISGINGVSLRKHQKDAIWMLLVNNGGIIDHLVGAGKTYVMVAGTMEMKRTGIAKKPMIIALKSTIPQIVESYRNAFPMAKVLAPLEKDFTKENRNKLFAQIANNEWDCIIMSHENYGKIPHELEIQQKFIQDEMAEVEAERAELDAAGNKQALKGLEIRLKNLEARLDKLNNLDKDNSITFEQMGIDHIMVDESQQFKNLSYVTKQRDVAGLSKAEGSKRAFNLFIGVRYLQQKYRADKGITFLSGTPISNSMVEMYLLLKYLRPNKMNELGFNSFDAWATTFASPSSDIEFTVTGNFKQKNRFREFINVPELSMLYREISDIRTDANTPLDKPKMKGEGYTVVNIKMSKDQKRYGRRLMRFAKTKNGSHIGMVLSDNQKTAAMLLATNLSSKMAIDMRLVNPSYAYDPNGKIAMLVDNVFDTFNKTNEHKGTQLIFSDLGTPKNKTNKSALLRDYMEDELGTNLDTLNEIFGDPNEAGYKIPAIGVVKDRMKNVLELSDTEIETIIEESENSAGSFNVYDEVKYRLIEKGIPEDQIVFIHDYNSQRAKEKLFKEVQQGNIRIVLGSTQKLGTGVNVQDRIVAMHHLDVPWTPAAMEQRNGRGIRQGNWVAKQHLNNEVPVYAYATELTLDAYKYQLLDTKQRFLDQVKSGDTTERIARESDGDSESGVGYAELVAMMSGNKDFLLKNKLEQKIDKLKRSKRNFQSEIYEAERSINAIENRIPTIEGNIKLSEENVEKLTNSMLKDKAGRMDVSDINGKKLANIKDDKGKERPAERTDYAKEAIQIIQDKLGKERADHKIDILTISGYKLVGYRTDKSGDLFAPVNVHLSVKADNGVEYSVNFSHIPGIFLNNIQKAIDNIPDLLSAQKSTLERNKRELESYRELLKNGKEWEKEQELTDATNELKEVNKRLNESNKFPAQRAKKILDYYKENGGNFDTFIDQIESTDIESINDGVVEKYYEGIAEIQRFSHFNGYENEVKRIQDKLLEDLTKEIDRLLILEQNTASENQANKEVKNPEPEPTPVEPAQPKSPLQEVLDNGKQVVEIKKNQNQELSKNPLEGKTITAPGMKLLPVEEFRHTKTGQILWNVKINGRSDLYDHMVTVAKRHNPHDKRHPFNTRYSKGFLFEKKEDAQRFKNAIDGNDDAQFRLIGETGAANLEVSISDLASPDLSGRPNVVKTLTKISEELSEPVNFIASSEIPGDIQEKIKKRILNGSRVPAYYSNGKIYIISDKITSVSDAVKSYLHETIIHKGLRNTFAQADKVSIIGKQYTKLNDLLIDVFNSMSRSQKMAIASLYAKGLYNKNGKITRNPSAEEKALIGEEFLAHVSENQEIYDAPVLSKWQEFINRLLQIIRKAFRLTSNQFSQSDLLDIIRESRARLKDKAKGTTEESSRLRVTDEIVSLGEKPNDMNNTILIDGVPRPTLNSKGLPIAQTEEGIRNFWKWFGDSKVVDEQGKPLVVYHGTNADFDEFHDKYHKESFFFTTDKELALSYGTRTVEAYLSLQMPLDTNSNIEYTDVFYDKQKRGEYDGIIYNSETEKGEPINSIVAFSPSQIKSATGNNGSFDPDNNDIRFRVEELTNLTSLPNSIKTSDLLKSVNETVEANMNESHGIKKMPLWDRIKQKLAEIKESTQHFKHITEKDFPEVYDKLRQFEAIPDRVKKEAFEKVSQIVRPLIKNEEHMKAFERYIVLQDLVHDIEETELFANKELPWGYNTIDEIKTDMRNVRSYVMRTPVVLKAIRERQSMMKEIKKELVAAKLLKDNGNDNYFHHQVLAFMDNRANVGVSAKDVRNHKKGWQRSRQGSIALYNTNYIESEFEVMAQSLEQLAIKNLLGEINEGINIMPKLVEKAKKEGGNWKDYIPDGYKYWFPKPGTNAYKAASMAEKAVRNILQDPDNPELQEILAEAEGSMWVIPEQVAKQLDEMKDREKEVIYAEMLRATTGKWKQWTLLNPFRAAKYNFNNMSGDLDIVLAYNPKILEKKYAHKSMTEALDEMRGKGMSEDMKEALKYGVITSGLSIQEIPDINSQSLFRSLTKGQGTWAKRAFGRTLGSYWAGVTAFTQFRENILRVAAYKFFKDQINAGKKPIGASKHDAIQALYASGVSANEIAGKLARELMGDYGNLSQAGQWLRAHSFPFWSWVEINAPRYYQMLKNTKFEGNSGVIGQIAGVGAKKTAVNVGMLAVRAMLMMALVVAWNRIFFPDEDDELQKLGDDKLKLIIGRREDGSIMTIKIQGAFSDVLSFFSLEDAVSDVKELREGKTTAGKKLAESGNAFVNKFAQGAMPMTRASMELAMGKSLYPDVFDPRTIRDRGEHAARLVSMDKLYNYLTHKPVRSYGKEVSSLLVYDNNPGEAAYYTMREKINEFLKDNEEDMPSSEPTDKSNALYYYKKSLKMGDEKTAKFWFEKYKELGGTAQGYKTSMKKGMLVNSVPKELRGKWLESLDAEDKEILDLANRWYLETYIKVGIPVNTKE